MLLSCLYVVKLSIGCDGVPDEMAVVAEGLVRRFGSVTALDGVDLEVPAGSVVALLGPNGAGKTTAVRIFATLLAPDAGTASVAGLDVVRQAPELRRVIGLSGQFAAVDEYLTGQENLFLIARLSGLRRRPAAARTDELLATFDLARVADSTVRTYSGGMRRRLDVAASLVADPPVLFLDEPTTGLDPRGRLGLWALLTELTERGTTLLLTTQYLEEADQLADQIVVMDDGRIIAEGTSDQLKSRVGGDRLELRALPGTDPAALARAMDGLGSEAPTADSDTGYVTIPVADGAGVLPDVAARLASHRLQVADVALRRPTLDDVFLSLTGQAAATSAPTGSPGRQDD